MYPMLLGDAAATPTAVDQDVGSFLLHVGAQPSAVDIVPFLRGYIAGAARDAAARSLIAHGVSETQVTGALRFLDLTKSSTMSTIYGIAALVSMAGSAFHGYRRNNSVGWAIWWGIWGGVFPVVVPAIAFAQGFGKRKAA